VIRRDQHVEIAVAIDVRVGGTARDDGPGEIGAYAAADVLELALAQIAEQQRRLLELDARLDPPDLLLDVAIRSKYVGQPVEVVVEKEDAEGERQQAGAPDGGRGRLVDEQPGALVVIEDVGASSTNSPEPSL
jgi:hypothetical protein